MVAAKARESFRLRLSAVTPFLVGSGRELGPLDYTITVNPRSGAPLLRMIDTERFLAESPLSEEKKLEVIEKRTSGSLDRYSRYVLSCTFRPLPDGLRLREFSRGADGMPCVPASAVRGMLRTVALYASLSKSPQLVQQTVAAAAERHWQRDHAGDRFERAGLGESRETDALRALSVGESAPLVNDDLKAFEVAALTPQDGPLRVKSMLYVEAVAPTANVAFEFPVRLDPSLLESGHGAALRSSASLLDALRQFSAALVDVERRFYRDLGAREHARLFERVVEAGAGRAILPLGFGGGWLARTVGLLLGPLDLDRLAPLLSPGRRYYGHRNSPVFPKSRRWVFDGGRPSMPFGWVAVENPDPGYLEKADG